MGKRVAAVGDVVRYTCRIGDKTINGVGRISRGSPDTKVDGKDLARDGDTVNCGACGTGIIQATAKNRCNGKRIARYNDTVRLPTGSGRIVTASITTSSE